MFFYQEKVVWITGASSGIGLAIVELLCRPGARLIITSSDVTRLKSVAEKCNSCGAECKILPCDLSNSQQVAGIAAKALAIFGKVDVLILNAGKSQRSLAIETSINVDRYLMELDYFSNIIIAKHILKSMKANGGGYIAVTSSITGKFGFPLRSAYAAAKHALHGFFETLSIEERKHGVFVTIVCPGRINTPISYSAILPNGTTYNKQDQGQEKGMAAEVCARKYLRAIEKKKREVYIGKKEILMVYIKRFFPSIFYKIADSIKPT